MPPFHHLPGPVNIRGLLSPGKLAFNHLTATALNFRIICDTGDQTSAGEDQDGL